MLTAPSIMLRALQVAERKAAGPEICLERVLADLRQVGEPEPDDLWPLRESIRIAFEALAAARLLEYRGCGRFSVTNRGKHVIHDHPRGVDDSVLEAFPEYQAFLYQQGRKACGHTPVEEPKPQYSEGYAAFIAGKGLADNPHGFDSAAHLEWENGWGEAQRSKRGSGPNQPRLSPGTRPSPSIRSLPVRNP